jgi:hypothetical protein
VPDYQYENDQRNGVDRDNEKYRAVLFSLKVDASNTFQLQIPNVRFCNDHEVGWMKRCHSTGVSATRSIRYALLLAAFFERLILPSENRSPITDEKSFPLTGAASRECTMTILSICVRT